VLSGEGIAAVVQFAHENGGNVSLPGVRQKAIGHQFAANVVACEENGETGVHAEPPGNAQA
jgi:hypothetical protein